MAGARGPIGKRSDERVRRNLPENEGRLPVAKGEGIFDFEIPEPDDAWHPLAIQLYESLMDSGQCYWYQMSDWMLAYTVCESLSRDLEPQFVGMGQVWNERANALETRPMKMRIPLKGGSLTSYLRAFAGLGVSEGDRRRMNLELQRRDPEATPEQLADAAVVDARARFMG